MSRFRVAEHAFVAAFLLLAAALVGAGLARGTSSSAASTSGPVPVALAYAMPNQGWAPMTVYFSAFGSRDAAGDPPVRYQWDLDADGSFETDATASGGYVERTYVKPGEYPVGLQVTDAAGRTSTAVTTVTVRHPAASSVDYRSIFDDTVGRIDLMVTQEAWDDMWRVPSAKREVEADAVILGTRVDRIGLSMKGNASLEASNEKKPWKLDINAFVERQDYRGLSMVLLNNNFGDPSMLRETLAYEMLRFAGANAAFTRFVQVWIDITDDSDPPLYLGVYTMVERPDRDYVGNRFGWGNRHGNLYKADAWFEEGAADLAYYGEDIMDYPKPRGHLAYRLQPNAIGADYSDIITLCRTIDGTDYASPEEFAAALEQVFDVDSYLRYLAATFLHLNLDTYPYTGNNYYLFDDPGTGLFRWIAWDENNAWGGFGGEANFPLFGTLESMGPLQYAPLFTKVFQVERYRTTYVAYVDLLLRYWFNDEYFTQRAQAAHDLIAPYVTAATGDLAYVGPTARFNLDDFDYGWMDLASLTSRRHDLMAAAVAAYQPGGNP
jgi:spore coat protein H